MTLINALSVLPQTMQIAVVCFVLAPTLILVSLIFHILSYDVGIDGLIVHVRGIEIGIDGLTGAVACLAIIIGIISVLIEMSH